MGQDDLQKGDQNESSVEVVLDPELPIVDPHHHLWDMPEETLKYLTSSENPLSDIFRAVPRYLWDELRIDLGSGHNIRGTVFMECGAMYRADGPEDFKCVGETEFVNGVAAMSASGSYGDARICAGIVGRADLTIGAKVEEVLHAHISAGQGRFRGVRYGAAHDDDPDVLGPIHGVFRPGLYYETEFREGFKTLQSLKLSFDSWLLEPQLKDLIDLATAFPDTVIVLNHVGTPLGIGRYQGKRKERFGAWKENITTLASLPNVFAKIGGLGMPFLGWHPRMIKNSVSSARIASDWKPYVETVIEAFGHARCMFESNFPIERFGCSYSNLWNAFKQITASYSESERSALFSGTAKTVYRLELV